MTAEELADKVKRFASQEKGEIMDEIIGLSLELENVGDIRALTAII